MLRTEASKPDPRSVFKACLMSPSADPRSGSPELSFSSFLNDGFYESAWAGVPEEFKLDSGSGGVAPISELDEEPEIENERHSWEALFNRAIYEAAHSSVMKTTSEYRDIHKRDKKKIKKMHAERIAQMGTPARYIPKCQHPTDFTSAS